MTEEIELLAVHDGDDSVWNVGQSASRITLVADGRGPMGWYDQIHVYSEMHGEIIIPAHQAKSWTRRPDPT